MCIDCGKMTSTHFLFANYGDNIPYFTTNIKDFRAFFSFLIVQYKSERDSCWTLDKNRITNGDFSQWFAQWKLIYWIISKKIYYMGDIDCSHDTSIPYITSIPARLPQDV